MAHARLGAASCFVFSGDAQAPFKELQSLLIERVPLRGLAIPTTTVSLLWQEEGP